MYPRSTIGIPFPPGGFTHRPVLPGGLLFLGLAAACGRGTPGPAYVGTSECVKCHQAEYRSWLGSDHDLAMQEASDTTVLGDFNDASFTYAGLTSRFHRVGSEFRVTTDGPDGELHDYAIRYTFGVTPLQQYLIEFPGGRLQALGIAWDSRPAADGGQRWFHLYPHDSVTAGDPLHWTQRTQNWNQGCAVCHSTNLTKGYDPQTDTYHTTWSDIDVGCEACHGPGSDHLEWAAHDHAEYRSGSAGLMALSGRNRSTWVRDENSPTAHLSPSPGGAGKGEAEARIGRQTELTTCAPCHSRRAQLAEGLRPGEPLLDGYRPAVLAEGLYYPDGQIEDEVYVYGSFLQSRMYHQGVTCSDCHDPHSLKLRQPGNAVCATCHDPATYDTTAHHHHTVGTEGSSCVACHMPTRTYMGVDDRLDHSIRIPRPDLSESLGTPNACTECHATRSPRWARRALTRWYGATVDSSRDYAAILAASRDHAPRAELKLPALAGGSSTPAIVRATALSLLAQYPSGAALETVKRALDDPDPLIRTYALGSLAMAPPLERMRLAEHRLADSVLAVRAEAGRMLAATARDALTPAQGAALDSAIADYLAIQTLNADRPEAWVNRGLVEADRGRYQDAEEAYRAAIGIDSTWVPAWVNLADLFRRQARDDDAEQVLREALGVVRETAAVHHALGLLLVRRKDMEQALDELRQAAEIAPEVARYVYVYAVALGNSATPAAALPVLERGLVDHPNDRQMVFALATLYRDSGRPDRGLPLARRLTQLEPLSERAQLLLDDLERAARNGRGRSSPR